MKLAVWCVLLVMVLAAVGGGSVHAFSKTMRRMWDGEEARERVKRSRLFWW